MQDLQHFSLVNNNSKATLLYTTHARQVITETLYRCVSCLMFQGKENKAYYSNETFRISVAI